LKKIALVFLLLLTISAGLAQDTKPADKLPLHLGIVLHASKNTFPQQQAAAIDLIQRVMHSTDDEAFVVTAGGDRPWPSPRLDWDNKPDNLIKFVKGLDKLAGVPEAFKFEVQTTSNPNFREWLTLYKGAPTAQSVFAIVAAMMSSDARPARHVLVMFRDPWDHSPGWGSAYGQYVDQRHDAVLSMLKDARINLYVVGIDDPSGRPKMAGGIDTDYTMVHAGSGSYMRNLDEELGKAINVLMAAGRTNIERLTGGTDGAVAYGTKKNYADAVPVIADKIAAGTSPNPVGK
jgi:hypothetical protein